MRVLFYLPSSGFLAWMVPWRRGAPVGDPHRPPRADTREALCRFDSTDPHNGHVWDLSGRVVVAAEGRGRGRSGAKDKAYDFVKKRVLQGVYAGGDLISEGEVAESLGMSRTPVREAFLRLEAEGLLRLYPQRGALVVPVSPEEVRAVLEARLVLERFAAEKVIQAGSAMCEAVSRRLETHLARQRAKGEQRRFDAFFEEDRLFHTALVEAAGNELLAGLYVSLRDRQVRMGAESTVREPGRAQSILAEHAEIAEAVRVGDLARAFTAVRTHIAGTRSALGLTPETAEPAASRGRARGRAGSR
jgi:DNA-binding GntR family transcriptional regulator